MTLAAVLIGLGAALWLLTAVALVRDRELTRARRAAVIVVLVAALPAAALMWFSR